MVTTANSITLAARLFGSSVAATGQSAQLIVHDDQIEVRTVDRQLRCRFADLKIREVGFGRELGLELAWEDVDGAHAVHVLQPDSVRQLRSHPSFTNSPQLQTLSRTGNRRSVGRTLGWIMILTIVLLPVLLILVFVWQADRIAEVLASKVPIEQEERLGEAAFASMQASLRIEDSGPAHDAVQQLGMRLAKGSSYSYRFYVAEDKSINAFALPGGIIVVHTGLIAATDRPEELAGVLAHEIQHVEQRHSLRGAFKELGLRGLWALATGDVGSTIAGQAALELTSRKFSRSDESSADAGAFDMLTKQGVDPDGMVEFFTTMSAQPGAEVPEFLSTHPAPMDRQRALKQRTDEYQARRFETLSIGRWPPIEPPAN